MLRLKASTATGIGSSVRPKCGSTKNSQNSWTSAEVPRNTSIYAVAIQRSGQNGEILARPASQREDHGEHAGHRRDLDRDPGAVQQRRQEQAEIREARHHEPGREAHQKADEEVPVVETALLLHR